MSDACRFSWTELPTDTPMANVQRQRIIGAQMMISRVRLARGFFVPTHQHANEQFAVLLSGKMKFGVGAEGTPGHREFVLVGGEVLYLPANVPHSAEAMEDTEILDLFSPPSEKTGVDRS